MKRVFIIHGWDGHPEEGWLPWMKTELEAKGFEVTVPQMPNPETPRLDAWVPKLTALVGQADEETYFIGHSMGCKTIVKYLEALPPDVKVGGAVFVAGFLDRLTNVEEDDETQATAKLFLETPVDFEKVRRHLPKSMAMFSDNDEYVPLDSQKDFRDKLGSEIIVEHNQGHFNEAHGIKQLPVALKAVLQLSGKK